MGFRKWKRGQVPTKVIVVGNQTEGRRWIGPALSQLNILENQMAFQGLSQAWRTVKIAKGIIVECVRCFHIAEVKIHANIPHGGRKKAKSRECFCLCNSSVGEVVAIGTAPKEYTPHECDVEVCTDKHSYVLYLGIWPLDFFRYDVGDMVIVLEMESVDITYPEASNCDWPLTTFFRIMSVDCPEKKKEIEKDIY